MTTLLIDGQYQLHRIMHVPSLANLGTDEGLTGGVYGCLNVLKKTIDKFSPNRVVWVWDGSRSKRRMQLLPAYKANRDPSTPEDIEGRRVYRERFNKQQTMLNDIFAAAAVHTLRWHDREADDVLYVLSDVLEDHCVLVSDDWDFAQMVRPDVDLYRTTKDQVITDEDFYEQVGCQQEWYVLQHAIIGDKSDNIAGVMGVGKKTVQDIFAQFARHCDHDLVPGGADFFAYCATDSSKRVRKIAEAKEQILYNLSVVDVRAEIFPQDDIQSMKEKVETHRVLDEVSLGRQLKTYHMDTILKEFSYWVRSFRALR